MSDPTTPQSQDPAPEPPKSTNYFRRVVEIAKEHGATDENDLLLGAAIIAQESSGNPKAVSSTNAKGLMQFMPKTWEQYKPREDADPFDPEDNMHAGLNYLADLKKRYKGDYRRMLGEYYGGGPNNPYVDEVLGTLEGIKPKAQGFLQELGVQGQEQAQPQQSAQDSNYRMTGDEPILQMGETTIKDKQAPTTPGFTEYQPGKKYIEGLDGVVREAPQDSAQVANPLTDHEQVDDATRQRLLKRNPNSSDGSRIWLDINGVYPEPDRLAQLVRSTLPLEKRIPFDQVLELYQELGDTNPFANPSTSVDALSRSAISRKGKTIIPIGIPKEFSDLVDIVQREGYEVGKAKYTELARQHEIRLETQAREQQKKIAEYKSRADRDVPTLGILSSAYGGLDSAIAFAKWLDPNSKIATTLRSAQENIDADYRSMAAGGLGLAAAISSRFGANPVDDYLSNARLDLLEESQVRTEYAESKYQSSGAGSYYVTPDNIPYFRATRDIATNIVKSIAPNSLGHAIQVHSENVGRVQVNPFYLARATMEGVNQAAQMAPFAMTLGMAGGGYYYFLGKGLLKGENIGDVGAHALLAGALGEVMPITRGLAPILRPIATSQLFSVPNTLLDYKRQVDSYNSLPLDERVKSAKPQFNWNLYIQDSITGAALNITDLLPVHSEKFIANSSEFGRELTRANATEFPWADYNRNLRAQRLLPPAPPEVEATLLSQMEIGERLANLPDQSTLNNLAKGTLSSSLADLTSSNVRQAVIEFEKGITSYLSAVEKWDKDTPIQFLSDRQSVSKEIVRLKETLTKAKETLGPISKTLAESEISPINDVETIYKAKSAAKEIIANLKQVSAESLMTLKTKSRIPTAPKAQLDIARGAVESVQNLGAEVDLLSNRPIIDRVVTNVNRYDAPDGTSVYEGTFLRSDGQSEIVPLDGLTYDLYKQRLQRVGKLASEGKTEEVTRILHQEQPTDGDITLHRYNDIIAQEQKNIELEAKTQAKEATSPKPKMSEGLSKALGEFDAEKAKFDENLAKVKEQLARLKKYTNEPDFITDLRKLNQDADESAKTTKFNRESGGLDSTLLSRAIVTGYDLYRTLKEAGKGFAEWMDEMVKEFKGSSTEKEFEQITSEVDSLRKQLRKNQVTMKYTELDSDTFYELEKESINLQDTIREKEALGRAIAQKLDSASVIPYLPDIYEKMVFLNDTKTRANVRRNPDGTWSFDGEPVKLYHSTGGVDENAYNKAKEEFLAKREDILAEISAQQSFLENFKDTLTPDELGESLTRLDELYAQNREHQNSKPIKETYNRKFDEFSIAKYGSATDIGWYGIGVYMGDLQEASKYASGEGANIRPIYSRIENPLIWDYAKDSSMQRYLQNWKIENGQVLSPEDRAPGQAWKLPKEIHAEAEEFVRGYLEQKVQQHNRIGELQTEYSKLFDLLDSIENKIAKLSKIKDDPVAENQISELKKIKENVHKEAKEVGSKLNGKSSEKPYITDNDLHQLSRGITTIMKDKGYDGVFVIEESQLPKDAPPWTPVEVDASIQSYRIKEFVAFSPDQILSAFEGFTPRDINTGESYAYPKIRRSQAKEQGSTIIFTELAHGVVNTARWLNNAFTYKNRNLKEANKVSYESLLRASQSSPLVRTMLTSDAVRISRELKPLNMNFEDFISFAQQDRIEGIKSGILQELSFLRAATDDDFISRFNTQNKDNWISWYQAASKARPDLFPAKDLGSIIKQLKEATNKGDFSLVRQRMDSLFNLSLNNLDQPFAGNFQAASAHPAMVKAMGVWKSGMEPIVRDRFQQADGIPTQRLGPNKLYMPLVRDTEFNYVDSQGNKVSANKKVTIYSGASAAMAPAKVQFYATGMGKYTNNINLLSQSLRRVIGIGDKAGVANTLIEQGVALPVGKVINRVTGAVEIEPLLPGHTFFSAGEMKIFAKNKTVEVGTDTAKVDITTKKSYGIRKTETLGSSHQSIPLTADEIHHIDGYQIPNKILEQSGLQEFLEGSRTFSDEEKQNLIGRIIEASIVGPAEPSIHGWNQVKSLQQVIPFVDTDLWSPSTPVGQAMKTLAQVAFAIPAPSEAISYATGVKIPGLGILDLMLPAPKTAWTLYRVATKKIIQTGKVTTKQEMAELDSRLQILKALETGNIPTRAGMSTISPEISNNSTATLVGPMRYAPVRTLLNLMRKGIGKDPFPDPTDIGELHGPEKLLNFMNASPFIYGYNGLDLRVRALAMEAIMRTNSNLSATEVFDAVSCLGVYNRYFESTIGGKLKSTGLAPFYSAFSAQTRSGVRAWTRPYGGASWITKEGNNVPLALKFAAMMSESSYSMIAMWAIAHHNYTGKYPWEDPDSRLLQIKLSEKDRENWLAKLLFPDAARPAYLGWGPANFHIGERGARALGIDQAINTYNTLTRFEDATSTEEKLVFSGLMGAGQSASYMLGGGIGMSPLTRLPTELALGSEPRFQIKADKYSGQITAGLYHPQEGEFSSNLVAKRLARMLYETNSLLDTLGEMGDFTPDSHHEMVRGSGEIFAKYMANLALANIGKSQRDPQAEAVAYLRAILAARRSELKPRKESIRVQEEKKVKVGK